MNSELRHEYAALHTECGKLISTVATDKRDMTAEEKATQDKRYTRMDSIRTMDAEEKRLAKYAFEHEETENFSTKETKEKLAAAIDGAPLPKKGSDEYKQMHRDAINHYLRTGEKDQRFVITTGSTAMLPTYILPPTSIRRNNNSFRAILEATGNKPLETSDTATYDLPVWDDTGNAGDQPAENATSDVAVDVAVSGSVTIGAGLFSSKTRWFSNSVIMANGFDIVGYITPILQKSVDKKQESAWTTTLVALTGQTKVNASKAAVTYSELLAWEHTLPSAYRLDAAFSVSDTLYQGLRGLVDGNSRPIMDLDPTNVFQSSIHGKKVFINDYLSAMGTANGFAGAFISGEAIYLRDVVPSRLTRYVNIPSQRDQTGYDLFANGDCQFVKNGVALYQLAAS